MKSSIPQWPEANMDEMDELPDFLLDIEQKVIQQAESFNFFGKVVELFVPNALQTVLKMIGGDNPNAGGPGTNTPINAPSNQTMEWRKRPQSPRPSGNPNVHGRG